MEKEFVPYEQVSSLIALGFNEPVIAHRQYGLDICLLKQPEVLLTDLSMILYQQAFRWFREKYNLYPSINIYNDKWLCVIKSTVSSENEVSGHIVDTINNGHPTFNNYEEAELACLEKLIELIKNQK